MATKAKDFKSKPISKAEVTQAGVIPMIFPSIIDKMTMESIKKLSKIPQKRILDLEQRLHILQFELKQAIDQKTALLTIKSNDESAIKGDDAEVAEKQRSSNATLQELDIMRNRHTMVQRALMKMEQGIYGLCEETEEPIGFERLTVVPWARFGVQVQEVRERKMREYRVNRLNVEHS